MRSLSHDSVSTGQKAADVFSNAMGSWTFIIVQTGFIAVWVAVNLAGWVLHWDPYPFILLNLLFSVQAAYAAPIIMMSQNRQVQKDREMAVQDDAEIGLLVRLQQEQMASHRWQIDALRELLSVAGHPVSDDEIAAILPPVNASSETRPASARGE